MIINQPMFPQRILIINTAWSESGCINSRGFMENQNVGFFFLNIPFPALIDGV